MNLHLQPKQFLFLYNCLKRFEKDFLFDEEQELFDSTKQQFEEFILGTLEDLETQALSNGFDKWVKSETNKIQGLEDELKKIKETVPLDVLAGKFTPVKKTKAQGPGRPRKGK